jgi:nitrite reductase/ring-hydroxylating ferredoxin subunit/multimeric flavodoxin WrbA
MNWTDLGAVDELASKPLRTITIGRTKLAVTYRDGAFGVISGVCNHSGGPLGDGRIDDAGYVVCPWHNWKFHCTTGEGEPGYEADCVPRYEHKIEGGRLLVDLDSATRRNKLKHAPHPLARPVVRAAGPVRVVAISTTVMDESHPRYSTSDALLDTAVAHAQLLGAEAKLVRLNALKFRACEGYYSKSAQACTWPCSITQMDPGDQLDVVYEAIVHWADVILVATPIRWGAASSLYYKMVERMNCIQNQVTIRNRVLMKNKVASFIITGGQDNVQAVAGQMLGFFAEIGCTFPQFPYIAHTRGWSAEDMERNVAYVRGSEELHDGARALVARAIDTARFIVTHSEEEAVIGRREPLVRAGRKASMPVRKPDAGEQPDVYVEGEPMMKVNRGEELTEG